MSEPKINYLGPASEAAITTLQGLGYAYNGGQLWKPPIGKTPDFDQIDILRAERDALQLRLNAADQLIDELTPPVSPDPVTWGAPKTVRQLIQQLQTLDQDLRPLSMLRVPGSIFEDGKERVRGVHLSFSHERVDGQWLVPFKSEGEKVVAFWCRMEQPAPVAVASRDDSIYWLKRIDGIGQNRAELIYSMGFRRQTEPGES